MKTTPRERVTVSLPRYAAEHIREEAKRTGWSISALAAEYILNAIHPNPNADTLSALKEAKSGMAMEELTDYDIEHFEEFVAKL